MKRRRNGRLELVAGTERVVVLSAVYSPASRGGGPIRTLASLVKATPDDIDIAVVTSDRDAGSTSPLPVERNRWTHWEGVPCYYGSTASASALARMWTAIARRKPSLLYLNSFYSRPFSIVPLLLHKLGWCRRAAILLAPRGEFSPGALAIKPRRKRAYIILHRLLGLSTGVVWHASSPHEAQQIRAVLGPNVEIVVRENETALPPNATSPVLPSTGALRVVFLSRISRMKGLDLLLRGLSLTTERIDLFVYGPEEDRQFVDLCRALARDVRPAVSVRFGGPVAVADVRSVLLEFDLLALPTAGENFGHVIAEALSVSCPVMCSDSTPWTSRLRSGGGVVVDTPTPLAWAAALDDYASLDGAERYQRRREAGRAYGDWFAADKGPHVLELMRWRPRQVVHGSAADVTDSAHGATIPTEDGRLTANETTLTTDR